MILTAKQERFCKEYMIDQNGAQAAIRSGYSKKTAKEQATRLLTKVHVKNKIKELQNNTANSLNITKERVLNEYVKIAFADIRDLYDESGNLKSIKDLDQKTSSMLAGFEVEQRTMEDGKVSTIKKIKLLDRMRALEAIRKMLGFDEPEKVDFVGKKVTLKIGGKKLNKE